jgi:hypothetical protein
MPSEAKCANSLHTRSSVPSVALLETLDARHLRFWRSRLFLRRPAHVGLARIHGRRMHLRHAGHGGTDPGLPAEAPRRR